MCLIVGVYTVLCTVKDTLSTILRHLRDITKSYIRKSKKINLSSQFQADNDKELPPLNQYSITKSKINHTTKFTTKDIIYRHLVILFQTRTGHNKQENIITTSLV